MTIDRLPVIFFGHGSPMNAIELNEYSQSWKSIGENLRKPKAVLCVSAHWVTHGLAVTAMPDPRTIHDFIGFPKELFDYQYPAPGSLDLAQHTADLLSPNKVAFNTQWGLDHGSWSVLRWLFPDADVPVVQLSIDHTLSMEEHYHLGESLRVLRDEDILVIGSGNLVHNLNMASWDVKAYDWAIQYDEKVKYWILAGDHEAVIHYEKQGPNATFSVNSKEHYIPLMYVLGASYLDEKVQFFNEEVMAGSISMRGVYIG